MFNANILIHENMPPKFSAAVLLGALEEQDRNPQECRYPMLMGVVSHDQSIERIERVVEHAEKSSAGNYEISEYTVGDDQAASPVVKIDSNTQSLHVMSLQPYSVAAGLSFGSHLMDLSESK